MSDYVKYHPWCSSFSRARSDRVPKKFKIILQYFFMPAYADRFYYNKLSTACLYIEEKQQYNTNLSDTVIYAFCAILYRNNSSTR